MIPTWLAITGAVVGIVAAAITAYFSVRAANKETAETIRQLREERVFEKLRDQATKITKLEEHHAECAATRLPHLVARGDLQAMEKEIVEKIEDLRESDRVARKAIHEHISALQRDTTNTAADVRNITGWLKEQSGTTKELLAAVAKQAGIQEATLNG